jgi:hypothetical protein
MNASLRNRLPALFCASTLLVSWLLIQPHLDMGIADDWSYARTAQLFAQTGHFLYNGWSTPMLGWQTIFAALFIKLFGFSFDVLRSMTLVIAVAMAYLVQRTFVRAGLSQTNASIGTLSLILSPATVPMIFSFMTDIPGLFCIVLCFYACVRVLQASSNRTQLAWVAFAALSNAVGGTVRQIVWLGVLVMVPSALWLLRRNRRLLLYGGMLYAVSVIIIAAVMRWFAHQPYTVPEHLIDSTYIRYFLPNLSLNLRRAGEQFVLYLSPILFLFLAAIFRKPQRTPTAGKPTAEQLAVLLGPFTVAYIVMLLPRFTFVAFFDRYLLPLLFIGILVVLRYAQNNLSRSLPLVCIFPVLLFSTYAIAKTHDVFSMYRGRLAAVAELRSAGIPDTSIDGTQPYNGWAYLQRAVVVNDARLPGASEATIQASYRPDPPCPPTQGYLFPDLISRYTISWDRDGCAGAAPFAPIVYKQWLEPPSTLYIVYVSAPSAK